MYRELLDLLMEMEDSPARRKLADIFLKEIGEISLPFVQSPTTTIPYNITTTGGDWKTYAANIFEEIPQIKIVFSVNGVELE